MSKSSLIEEIKKERGKRKFTNVDLQGVDLSGLDLSGLILLMSNLSGTDLSGTNLSGAKLARTDLSGAKLTEANLKGTVLIKANLTGADLTGANLTEANLTEATLKGADLTGANLTEATLKGADLTGAVLDGNTTNLTGVDVTSFNFLSAILIRIPDQHHIHKEAGKINYSELIKHLNKSNVFGIKKIFDAKIDYPSYFFTSISNIISEKKEEESDKEKEQRVREHVRLKIIMDERLNSFNYKDISPNLLEVVYYTLEYVKTQPDHFKKIYVENWLNSCIDEANKEGRLSCVHGILERFIFALSTACTILLSSGLTDEKKEEEYTIIIRIINQNPEVLITEYIEDWYKLHSKEEFKFSKETSDDEKIDSLRKYVTELLQSSPGIDKLIEKKIQEYVEGVGLGEDYFKYLGGVGTRRKRKTSRTGILARKTIKNKNRKKMTKRIKPIVKRRRNKKMNTVKSKTLLDLKTIN